MTAALAVDLAAERARRDSSSPTETEGYILLGFEELLNLPDPAWLIEGVIPEGLGVIYGGAGTFKSFIAKSMAGCVATGRPWHGRSVNPGYVVYIAGEGRAGLKARVRAWWEVSGRPDMSRMRWLPEAINLRDRSVIQRLRTTIATLPERPKLIVVDTMARTLPGGDENSSKDVGEFVAAIDGLCRTRLVVHHTGHDPSRERGSSALRGAADLMLKIERDRKSPRVRLVCDKMKDAPEWPELTLLAEPSHGSLTFALVEKETPVDDLRERVLSFVTDHGPIGKRKVREGVTGRNADIDRALDALESDGLVSQSRSGWATCPDPAGTLGHFDTQANREGVPGGWDTPVGGAHRGTPDALSTEAVPDNAGHTIQEPAA